RSGVRAVLAPTVVGAPDLLPRLPDQISDDPAERGAREHHPDERGSRREEDEVHLYALHVGRDEDQQDHNDRERDRDLRQAGPALTIDGPEAALLGAHLVGRARTARGGGGAFAIVIRGWAFAMHGLPREAYMHSSVREIDSPGYQPIGAASQPQRRTGCIADRRT